MEKRMLFRSRFGALVTTAGSAIGLGNIWRFPYEMGVNGGGAYLLVYVLSIILLGIPIMVAEFVIGASTHRSADSAIRQLSPEGSKVHYGSYIGLLAVLLTLGFYSVVAGWVLGYFCYSGADLLTFSTPMAQGNWEELFSAFVGSPWRCVGCTIAVLLINHMILLFGVQRGVERVNRAVMPLMLGLLCGLAIRSLCLPGAAEGLRFMFVPTWQSISPKMVLSALGQAFFTLTLGCYLSETYASYFRPGARLVKTAGIVAALDTFVAVVAGVFIFPAIFAYGGQVAAGPKLLFEVLPMVFSQMAGSALWGTVFFFLVFIAALTSTISLSETLVATLEDNFAFSRTKAVTVITALALVIAVFSALSFSTLDFVTLMGENIFGILDYTVSHLMMPVSGLFVCWFVGWKMDQTVIRSLLSAKDENGRQRIDWYPLFSVLIRYVAPICVVSVFVYGLM